MAVPTVIRGISKAAMDAWRKRQAAQTAAKPTRSEVKDQLKREAEAAKIERDIAKERQTGGKSDPLREAEQMRRPNAFSSDPLMDAMEEKASGVTGGDINPLNFKKGGKVKVKMSSASKRADGIAQRGKTRGRFV